MKFEPMEIEEEVDSFYLGSYLPSGNVKNLIKFLTENQEHEIQIDNDDGMLDLKAVKWRTETIEEAKQRATFELQRQKEWLKTESEHREKCINELEEFLNSNK